MAQTIALKTKTELRCGFSLLQKKVQLILHRGAKKQIQPATKLIANPSKLLVWKENDRAIITFKSLDEITNAKSEIVAIINEWISATK